MLTVVSMIDRSFWAQVFAGCILIIAGLVLGIYSRKSNGEQFLKGIILSGFISATVILVIGPWILSPWSFSFPIFFVISLIMYGSFGLISAKFLARAR
jgi:hypothetical protein